MNRTIAATIRGGVAVSDAFADLPDGTEVIVAVLVDDDLLSEEQLSELDAAHGEADRGELVPAEDVLSRLEIRRSASSTHR